jgi:hypothetical protein
MNVMKGVKPIPVTSQAEAEELHSLAEGDCRYDCR